MNAVQKQKSNRPEIARCMGLLLGLQLLLTFSTPTPALGESHRRFTVRDSIEMNRFVNPNPYLQGETPILPEMFSPNGRQVIVITQRGRLAANELEDTVWLFDVDALRKCVAEGSTCAPPRALLRLAGVTTDLESEANVISNVRWLPSSEGLTFLGRNGRSTWHVYTVEVRTGTLHQLTPDDQNVGQFEMSGGLILYTALEPYHPPVAAPAVVATGRKLNSLLFPEEEAPWWPNRDQLWLIRNDQALPLVNPETRKQILINRNSNGTPPEILSVSPDGRHAVVNIAVTSLPSAWEKYVPGNFTYQLRYVPDELLQYQYADGVPERYVLVDLETGVTTVMLDAPLGRSLAYLAGGKGIQARVVWSKDGRRALLVNTFLPLGIKNAESAPAIVSYDLPSEKWTYVAPFKEAKNELWALSNVTWHEDEEEVVLQYSEGGPPTETYRVQSGEWRLVDRPGNDNQSAQPQTPPEAPLAISIRQDINSPPLLFAGSAHSAAKVIWDPNPQLNEFDLGEATPYRWSDKEGREVKGMLIKPPGYVAGKRYPLVIEPRMYSEHAFVIDGTYRTAAAARALTAVGVLVLQASEPNEPQAKMNGPEWYRSQMFAAIGGYEAAVTRLVSDGLVDRQRVGIFGFSRTVWNVTCALTRKPRLFAAATIVDGITFDYFQYLQSVDDKQVTDTLLAPYGVQPVGNGLQKWIESAPDLNLDKVDVPLRIESHDRRSLLGNWGTYSILRILHRPVDLIMLPGASHIVSMPLDLLESQQGDVDWFRFWLQDYEDPDPGKSAQYRRWEGLRRLRDQAKEAASSQSLLSATKR